MECPICKRTVLSTIGEDSPFCSERCRLIDLGNWASESYKVSAPISDMDEPSFHPGEGNTIAVTGDFGVNSPAQTRNEDGETQGS